MHNKNSTSEFVWKGGLFTKGIVVEIEGRYAIALSKDGTFLKVRNNGKFKVGCEIELDRGMRMGVQALARVSTIAAAFLFAMGVGYGAYCYTTPYSYVGVDINPSVELTTNMYDRIIKAEALNTDGKKLLETTSFQNAKIDKGVKALLNSAVKQGYLKQDAENTVVLSISSKDDSKSEHLENDLEGTASGALEQDKVATDLVMDTSSIKDHEKAKKSGVTTGRLDLMEKAVKAKPELKLEDLKDESVKDIMAKYGAAAADVNGGNSRKAKDAKVRVIRDEKAGDQDSSGKVENKKDGKGDTAGTQVSTNKGSNGQGNNGQNGNAPGNDSQSGNSQGQNTQAINKQDKSLQDMNSQKRNNQGKKNQGKGILDLFGLGSNGVNQDMNNGSQGKNGQDKNSRDKSGPDKSGKDDKSKGGGDKNNTGPDNSYKGNSSPNNNKQGSSNNTDNNKNNSGKGNSGKNDNPVIDRRDNGAEGNNSSSDKNGGDKSGQDSSSKGDSSRNKNTQDNKTQSGSSQGSRDRNSKTGIGDINKDKDPNADKKLVNDSNKAKSLGKSNKQGEDRSKDGRTGKRPASSNKLPVTDNRIGRKGN